VPASLTARGFSEGATAFAADGCSESTKVDRTALDDLLDRQRRAPLPVLYGQKPGISPTGEGTGQDRVSEVIDQGSEVVVLFSAMNVQEHAVELMPRRFSWWHEEKRKDRSQVTLVDGQQLPVTDFRMSRRRLGAGERADGGVSSSVHLSSSRPRRCSFRCRVGCVDRPVGSDRFWN